MLLLLALTACTPNLCDEAVAEGRVSLPADDGLHDEPVEWWYWTGHLQDDQGRWYGFQQTFFAMSVAGYEARSAHVALTDVEAGTFDYDIVYEAGTFPAATGGFDLAMAGQSAVGGGGDEALGATFDAIGWDLSLVSLERPVLQHGDGYHDYAAGGHTWYYSRERIAVDGILEVDGEQRPVTGQAWFDHQWGDLRAASDAGWDWFAIQLDDGREIMLFLVRGGDEVIGGTITDPGCTSREIAPGELEVVSLGTWTSPETECTYPVGWQVSVGDLEIVLDPVMEGQEMVNSYKTYWEGAHTVAGDATGRAYVELAGYCD